MTWETKEFGRIELLKELPRAPLAPETEHSILRKLRELGGMNAQFRKRRRIWRISFLASVAIVAFAIALFPLLSDLRSGGVPGNGPSEHSAEISPLFDLLEEDGSVVYEDRLRGIEGKIGFSEYPGGFIAKDEMRVSKVFWYAWGDPRTLIGSKLVAKAYNLDTGKRIQLDVSELRGAITGADAHAVTQFKEFPEKGIWRIDIELNGEPYGSIVVPVKDEYIHTESSRFLISKDDAFARELDTSLIVNGQGLADTLDVIVQRTDSPGQARKLTFVKEEEYLQAKDLTHVTRYGGTLVFDSPGRWRVEVLGEKTEVEVRP